MPTRTWNSVSCRRPLGGPGMSLPDWIRLVVAWRRQRAAGPAAGIAAGIGESLTAGVTTIGEIATDGWSLPPGTPAQRSDGIS